MEIRSEVSREAIARVREKFPDLAAVMEKGQLAFERKQVEDIAARVRDPRSDPYADDTVYARK